MAKTVYVSPRSAEPGSNGAGRIFPHLYQGATNSRRERGLGVQASLGADATWELRFAVPPTLAATPNAVLRLRALAPATAGDAKFNVLWALVGAGSVPDTATLNDEGLQTLTWAAGDSDKYKELDVALDVAAFAQADAGKELVVHLAFKTTSFTLAQKSAWIPYLKIDAA